MHGTLIMKENVSSLLLVSSSPNKLASDHVTRRRLLPEQSLKLVSSEQALKELGLNEHQLRFTCRVQLHDPHSDSDTLHRIYTHLKRSARRFSLPFAFPLFLCNASLSLLTTHPVFQSLQAWK